MIRDCVQSIVKPLVQPITGDLFDILSLGPLAWWDMTDASTITESGTLVSQLDDKSGNGYNATQGTGSLQPSVMAGGLSFQSGKRLQLTALLNVRTFAVVYKNTNLNFATMFTDGSGAIHGNDSQDSIFNSSLTFAPIYNADHYRNGEVFNIRFGTPGALDDQPTANSVFIINSTGPFSESVKPWYIGGDRTSTSRTVDSISELIAFDRLLSTSEIAQLNAFLQAKHSI